MRLKLSEPFWWYGKHHMGLPQILYPAALIYGAVAGRRMNRQPVYTAPIPVICVGNFVVGGSGKSPIVRALVATLKARGLKPAILSRGYGGKLKGPVWVEPALHTFADVGDEPLMLAADAPVMIAARRDAGARAIVGTGGFDVIVMDDGLQNPDLAKSLSIAVVNGARGLGNRHVVPAGPLRAPLSVQTGKVDAIVITGHDAQDLRLHMSRTKPNSPPIAMTEITARPIQRLANRARVFVFAAIAHPQRVFESARSLGLDVVNTLAFPDHHAFTDAEISQLAAAAKAIDAELVTTEKDIVRLRTGSTAARKLSQCTHVLKIEVKFSSPEALDVLLDKALTPQQQST